MTANQVVIPIALLFFAGFIVFGFVYHWKRNKKQSKQVHDAHKPSANHHTGSIEHIIPTSGLVGSDHRGGE